MDLGSSNFFFLIFALIISITLHEAMHAYTSFWLGDDTAHAEGRISLNPLRHIDPFMTILLPIITLLVAGIPLLAAKPVPFNPGRVKFEEFGAALIAIAGPLTNLVLAIIGAVFLRGVGGEFGADIYRFFLTFIQLNVALFVFNMIPIPPLDGSRVLYAFAPESVQAFMAQLEQIGIFIVFALILVVPGFTDALIDVNLSVLKVLL